MSAADFGTRVSFVARALALHAQQSDPGAAPLDHHSWIERATVFVIASDALAQVDRAIREGGA